MLVSDLVVRIAADWLVLVAVGIAFVVVWQLPKRERFEAAGRSLVMLLVGLLLAKLTSLFYSGSRPFEALGVAPGASYLNNPGFPSDHSLLVFSLAIIVWVLTKNRHLTAWMFALAVCVALARVAALVHTPLDVAGGALIAFFAALPVYGQKLFKRN